MVSDLKLNGQHEQALSRAPRTDPQHDGRGQQHPRDRPYVWGE